MDAYVQSMTGQNIADSSAFSRSCDGFSQTLQRDHNIPFRYCRWRPSTQYVFARVLEYSAPVEMDLTRSGPAVELPTFVFSLLARTKSERIEPITSKIKFS